MTKVFFAASGAKKEDSDLQPWNMVKRMKHDQIAKALLTKTGISPISPSSVLY